MDWSYDSWPSGEPYDWGGAGRGETKWDAMDYHVDLGCGTLKKGRIGIDRFAAPGVNIVMDLDKLRVLSVAPGVGLDAPAPEGVPHVATLSMGLPFEDSSIESIITHHCLEHIGGGFIPLMDEIYRVLKPDGIFRGIVPLFPSHSAVADPDHKRYFMVGTFTSFCGHLGDENNPTGSWLDSFSVPYTKARFEMLHEDHTGPVPVHQQWTSDDVRELRVAMRAVKA
jgi:SAM-dependent methyltransferase